MAVSASTRTRTLLLTVGALLLVAPVGGWSPASWTSRAVADGVGPRALDLSVTVNTRPGREAERTGVRVGDVVVKEYRLTNRSGADLHRVTVTDPAVPEAALHCPEGQGFAMRGLTTVTCVSRVSAAPGVQTATVVARGEIPSLGMETLASADAGYQGVAGALALDVAVNTAAEPLPVVQYTITNQGNSTVYDVQLTDQALGQSPVVCDGQPAPPQALAPGAAVVCTATVAGLQPGVYPSTPEVRGSDFLSTLGSTGGLVAAPPLVAGAAPLLTAPAGPSAAPPAPAVPAVPGAAAAVPGAMPGTATEAAPGAVPGTATEAAPGAVPGTATEAAPGAVPGTAAEAAPGAAATAAPGTAAAPEAPATAPGTAAAVPGIPPGAAVEAAPEAVPGTTPETLPEATPEAVPEATPEATAEAAPEATSETAPEAAPGPTPAPAPGAAGAAPAPGSSDDAALALPPPAGLVPPGELERRDPRTPSAAGTTPPPGKRVEPRPSESPTSAYLPPRADEAPRRDRTLSPLMSLLLLLLPAVVLIVLAGRRL
ncbi:hypothetical protein RND61_25605 [Streptomyces sp. TRM76323]|uniref:DUF7507 domain-containing protein n=1 Tax=Streptomyces tamarix TaxID=3078565 RepID=A0ABU3QSE3_9ACTN|nr:hypothetical protein [Streptomyces tamarix]MDT9685414.1 hypothetical protein [Streptomyces tamarix]